MPIGAPIAALIGSAISGGTAITAGVLNHNAQTDAQNTQRDYNDRALAAQQEQQTYERQKAELDRQREIEEFNQNFGLNQSKFDYSKQQDALNRDQLLERQGYQRGQFNQYLGRLQPFSQGGQSVLPQLAGLITPSAAGFGSGGGVQMRAPDGSLSMVDPDHVDHYASLGAQRVQ
jgi:hypothetical protein